MAASIPAFSDSVPAMEMRDVTVVSLRDPGQVVVEGINWTVQPGEFWVIGGLLRTGKSDLMSVAAGIMPPGRGTYRLLGRELTSGFEREQLSLRLRVALVFDGGHLLHHLTLAENIALPLRYHFHQTDAQTEDFLHSLLQLTGLEAWADSYPGYVNRNWQQRIGLARALALKPEVLLLDSPLSGLDPRDAIWWLDIIQALVAGHPIMDNKALTIVVTSDNLGPWQDRADHFAALRDRQLVLLGGRSDLADHPERSVRDLLPLTASPHNVKNT